MDLVTLNHLPFAAANVPVSRNPTLSTNPFFEIAIRYELDPYWVCRHLNIDIDSSSPETLAKTKLWTWKRFGQTTTTLPDGRIVYIGGEHEDWYDPMFFIFNDVVIENPETGRFDLYRYPLSVFPPTDFHTATLDPIRRCIWIIGCLGNVGQRGTKTPVYRLDIDTFRIEQVQTRGDESPGWIWGHEARLEGNNGIIVVTDKTWRLDLTEKTWTH